LLYIFDLDGTLIQGHLETVMCPDCTGSGCTACNHKGRIFGAKRPYDNVTWLPGVRDRLSRKPGTGMIEDAMTARGLQWGFDDRDVVFVGDLATDKQAAEAACVRFAWAHEFFEFDPALA
jgi:histidinol phosphatase-like enzyme